MSVLTARCHCIRKKLYHLPRKTTSSHGTAQVCVRCNQPKFRIIESQGKGDAGKRKPNATVAESVSPSVGVAGAGSGSVKDVCKKTSGECPATASRGNVRTVEGRTDSGINSYFFFLSSSLRSTKTHTDISGRSSLSVFNSMVSKNRPFVVVVFSTVN